jgi:hypothetical protein
MTYSAETRQPAADQHAGHLPQESLPAGSAQAFVDRRPTTATQVQLRAMIDASPRHAGAQALKQLMTGGAPARHEELAAGATPKPNHTGLPDQLKSGIESLSGISMDHVTVHRNSSQPTQLHAHAFAQGSEIHLAPGQEQHLPHEAWHVVQQAQGRVGPTKQMQGTHVNDDAGLESEADLMGSKAMASSGVLEQHARGPTLQSSAPVAQRYVDIDLDVAQRWADVRHQFSAFRPTPQKQEAGSESFIMRYVEGPPESSRLSVSDAGNLAISADAVAQHTVFFIASGPLAIANDDLAGAGSKFLLAPTGVAVEVNNHPHDGERRRLLQVRAQPTGDRGEHWMRELDTHCNVYFKNITKAHAKFEEVLGTTAEENLSGAISPERRQQLDEVLAGRTLIAGDAFKIKSLVGAKPGLGWNEHFAGIVAVDGDDQVTLENYNRDSELGDKMQAMATTMLGKTGQALETDLSRLRRELSRKGCFQWSAKAALRVEIAQAEQLMARWNAFMSSKIDNVATHHFKIYGPAKKGQSFLDKWRGDMDQQQSMLSTAKADRGKGREPREEKR